MQRKRSELIPVGEVFSNLDGPVKAIREASPQATFHFNQADQVNQLVSAREADPDLGFMARPAGAVQPAWRRWGRFRGEKPQVVLSASARAAVRTSAGSRWKC